MFEFIESSFNQYGYIFVFLGALAESLVFLGLFLPGAVVVILGGFYASRGELSLPGVILLGFAGMYLGDILNYYLGASKLRRKIEDTKFGKKLFAKKDRVKIFLHNNGFFSFYYAHFIGSLRSVICFLAGATHYPKKTYFIHTFVASFVWAVIYGSIGYFAAESIRDIEDIQRQIGIIALAGAGIFVIFKLLQKYLAAVYRARNKNVR